MRDISELLSSWQQHDPTLPRLTWYGADDERVELSGRVLANWVIKAANLLGEETGGEQDAPVLVDLPQHWRALVWAMGGWLSGAQVHFGTHFTATQPDLDSPEVVITAEPQTAPAAEVLIAVALPALAMTFEGDLPVGAVDGASDLMTYPDELIQPAAATDLHALAEALDADPASPGGGALEQRALRVLLETSAAPGTTTVARCLHIWLAGGSVVIVATGGPDAEHVAKMEEARPW